MNFNEVYIGCANARNKGTRDNKATMRRGYLETDVLEGLQHRLMELGRPKIFCEEYARAINRLHARRALSSARLSKSRVNVSLISRLAFS